MNGSRAQCLMTCGMTPVNSNRKDLSHTGAAADRGREDTDWLPVDPNIAVMRDSLIIPVTPMPACPRHTFGFLVMMSAVLAASRSAPMLRRSSPSVRRRQACPGVGHADSARTISRITPGPHSSAFLADRAAVRRVTLPRLSAAPATRGEHLMSACKALLLHSAKQGSRHRKLQWSSGRRQPCVQLPWSAAAQHRRTAAQCRIGARRYGVTAP